MSDEKRKTQRLISIIVEEAAAAVRRTWKEKLSQKNHEVSNRFADAFATLEDPSYISEPQKEDPSPSPEIKMAEDSMKKLLKNLLEGEFTVEVTFPPEKD